MFGLHYATRTRGVISRKLLFGVARRPREVRTVFFRFKSSGVFFFCITRFAAYHIVL